MRYDMHLLFVLVGIGIWKKDLDWRGWLLVVLFIFSWMMYCWLRA